LQHNLHSVGFFLSAINSITKHYELAKAMAKDDATPEEIRRAFDLLPETTLTRTQEVA